MRIGKLWLSAVLSAIPAVAQAQVSVGVGVNVDIDANAYDTTAPGDPVESVDVFYDQLQPYGVWVDEPEIGRVFIPSEDNFVPYTTGHWEYTRLGFVWISNEPHAWATSHYGRWAYSNPYGRWVWSPDTEWGPAWVEWRQTSTDFGWAPLGPTQYASYSPPQDSWHYCGADHVLDVNVTRYYEPRERVVVIHREARPIEHYSTVSNVRVVVGPPPSVLRDHRVEARPVRVEQKTIGRWSQTEARAQVQRAQEHRATFEVENQRRVEANTRVHTAQVKVIDTHPQLKAQVNVRMEAAKQGKAPPPEANRPGQPNRGEPNRPEANKPGMPNRVEPNRPEANKPGMPPMRGGTEPNKPAEPNKPGTRPEPTHAEPNRPEPAKPAQPGRPTGFEPKTRPGIEKAGEAPRPAEPPRAQPTHETPRPIETKPAAPRPAETHAQPAPRPAEPRPAESHVQPAPRPAEPRPEPRPAESHAQPAPRPAEPHAPAAAHPAPAHPEGGHPAPHAEPDKK